MEEYKEYEILFDNYCISIGVHSVKNFTIEIYKDYGEDDDILAGKRKSGELIADRKHIGYIADMRNFKGASPAAMLYVQNVWFPEAFKNGLRYGALMFGPDIFSHFAVETAIDNPFAKKMIIEKFLTLKEAENWLIQKFSTHNEADFL